MDAIRPFSRAVDWLSDKAGLVAEWLVLIACLISAGNASIRYLFNASSNGWLEIQWYCFGALVFLGASQTLRMNEHVRVDIVYSSVSDRARLWIDTVGFLFFMIPVTGFFTILSTPFFVQSIRLGEVSNNAGGLILWPIKAILPIGFGLLTLQGCSELFKRIAALQGRMQVETKYEKPLQ